MAGRADGNKKKSRPIAQNKHDKSALGSLSSFAHNSAAAAVAIEIILAFFGNHEY
jgi:hypothetical protein